MKILIIPDVHGRNFWIEPCKHVDDYDKVIFLGDYHDPYIWQVSIQESRDNLKLLEEFITSNKDKIVCLLGNHDYSYITGFAPCRYDYEEEEQVKQFLNKLDLKVAYKINNYLFSHSGLLPTWMDACEFSLNDILNLDINNNYLSEVSPNRGGWHSRCGSIIWGDLEEYIYSNHLPNYYQIFGHTQLKNDEGIIAEDYACLDCRQTYILNTETKELKKYENTNSKQIEK